MPAPRHRAGEQTTDGRTAGDRRRRRIAIEEDVALRRWNRQRPRQLERHRLRRRARIEKNSWRFGTTVRSPSSPAAAVMREPM
jgi:hypothetical protein